MKKKTIAIVLSVLLVVSAVLVLAACQQDDGEFQVVFRNYTGRAYFTLKTVDGKISKDAVDAELAKITPPKDGEEDMAFMGWYSQISQNDSGKYLFDGAIDYNKTYTEDAEYYAYWHVGAGLPQGYTVIGVINGQSCWTPGDEPESWMLVQDEDEPWLYRADFTITAGDQIKVKEKSNAWNNDLCNLGMWGLQDVILDEGVTLPEGMKAKGDSKEKDKTSIIYGDPSEAGKTTENALVGAMVDTAEITIEYDYADKQFRIYVHSITFKTEVKEVYVLAGSFGGDNDWNPGNTAEEYNFTPVDGQEGKWELTFTFVADQQFLVTNGSWSWKAGWDAEKVTVTAGAGVGSVEGIFVDAGSDGNIKVTQGCTVKITLTVATHALAIEVTALTPAA